MRGVLKARRDAQYRWHYNRWTVFQAAMYVMSEVKNGRGYLNGSMGEPVTPRLRQQIETRINTGLIKAEQAGCQLDDMWRYVLDFDLDFPEVTYGLLVQYSVIAEFGARMWQTRTGKDNYIYRDTRLTDADLVLNYMHSRRMLRRYHAVDRSQLRSWLPSNFKL